MLDRRRLASCLLLSVVALGFLVSQASATSTQGGLFAYEGYVRMTRWFFEIVQQAIVELQVPSPGSNVGHLMLHTPGGYTIDCAAWVIYGGGGSVSASCIDIHYGYVKFWTLGLIGFGLVPGVPATVNFYIPPFRGQFVGFPII